MVRIKVNGTWYHVKTKWSEVDAERLVKCKDFREELACMTDLPLDIIKKAAQEQLWPIYTCTSFIDDLEGVPFPEVEVDKVAFRKYEEMELAKQKLQTGKPHQRVLGVALVYYPEERDAERLISIGISLIKQITVFLSTYEDMSSDPVEGLKLQAGLEDLTAFGSWGTAFTLAGRDVLKVRQIFAMKAIEVYTALHYSWREEKFKERYFELKHPKKTK